MADAVGCLRAVADDRGVLGPLVGLRPRGLAGTAFPSGFDEPRADVRGD
jgi:hypothetical protein